MSDTSRRRPRQADIAREAGVSQATVSLVINERRPDSMRIPPETRQRVLEVARALGYVANPVARSLAGGKNQLIGVYTFESMFPMDHHDFYHPFLVGIEAAAESLGYDMLMFTSATGSDGGRSIYRDGVNRLQLADGCVVLGKATNKDDIVRLRDEGFDFVLIGRRDIPDDAVTYVTANYDVATTEVVDHLVALGHRRIAYLPSRVASEPADDRDAGFRAARERHDVDTDGLVLPVEETGPTPDEVRQLLDRGATAFVSHESVVAVRVIELLAGLGVDVPGDASVAALNDPPDTYTGPELTCFRIPRREMGAKAVELLVERISAVDEVAPAAVSLPCTFAAGETSGRKSGASE